MERLEQARGYRHNLWPLDNGGNLRRHPPRLGQKLANFALMYVNYAAVRANLRAGLPIGEMRITASARVS